MQLKPMIYSDDDLLMLSGLQHLVFCQRQCALIHLEGIWAENRLTAEGQLLHAKVDQINTESRVKTRSATAVRLKSSRLGLVGIADKVDFYQSDRGTDDAGNCMAVALPGVRGLWSPFPVEYKRGIPKSHRADEIQLCAQALCLEEMLGVHIQAGALFYGTPRRRTDVAFDPELRRLTEITSTQYHALILSGITPPAVYEKKCLACSLIDSCLPKITHKAKSARQWLAQELRHNLEAETVVLPAESRDRLPGDESHDTPAAGDT